MRYTSTAVPSPAGTQVHHRYLRLQEADIFYREAGIPGRPVLLLLHGFPTSSHMFRNLIPALAHRYHLIAPDFPGFGNSSMPSADAFEYSFDHLAAVTEQFIDAKELTRFSLYVMDYGAPVGFRIATRRPEQVQALLVQNGNAYTEGFSPFWNSIRAYWANPSDEANITAMKAMLTPEATQWQYTNGTHNPALISPDNWIIDQAGLDRPGNQDIQLRLFYDYRTNPERYAEWQAYFRQYQPPTLITWGKNDAIFPASGAQAYLKDLPQAELHLFDTGHFALEEEGAVIAMLIDAFLQKNIPA